MLRRNRSKLLGPTRPQQRRLPAPVAPPVDERQFQGPPAQGPPQGPPQPRQTDWRQDWSSQGPGNARTMPPPPSITAFRPPTRSRMVAGPTMLQQPASTRIPIEDPVEQWTPSSFVDTPKKQSRANRATFMFAALLLIIVVVAYVVRKRNSIARGGGYGSVGSFGSSYGGGYSVNDGYANW